MNDNYRVFFDEIKRLNNEIRCMEGHYKDDRSIHIKENVRLKKILGAITDTIMNEKSSKKAINLCLQILDVRHDQDMHLVYDGKKWRIKRV